jgi:G3E family GTPase
MIFLGGTPDMAVPALIVSGYLGSGKTTLVGRLLDAARRDGVRLAILSNEFGETGIDRALLDAGEEGYVELDGGCVCCKLSDALVDTIVAVLERAKPDRLVVETSGVALPGEIQLMFWRPPLSELVSDEVVVVVVDGERLVGGDLDDTAVEQIEAADLLLLNKCDLIGSDEQDRGEERLKQLSNGQPVIRTVRAEVDPALLFPSDPEGARVARRDPGAQPHDHEHERFDSFELRFEDGVTEEDVLARVAAEDAIRAKGFVRTKEGVRVVQGVGRRIEVTEPRVPVADRLIGRVVVIRRV